MAQQFRKLNINLPKQPLPDQRVWAVAGWLLVAIIIIIIAISYIHYVNGSDTEESKNSFESSVNKDCSVPILIS